MTVDLPSSRRARMLVTALFLGASGCRDRPNAAAVGSAVPIASAAVGAASVSGAPSAAAAVSAGGIPPSIVPTYRFPPEGQTRRNGAFFAIDGALLVAVENRVLRIVGDKLEPVGEVQKENGAFGYTRIRKVQGTWPDGVDVLHHTSEGRAPQPTYVPLTGKGRSVMVGEGGINGSIDSIAAVGGSTLIASHSFLGGYDLRTVRGPKLARKSQTQIQAGCKPGEVTRHVGGVPFPALQPELIAGTSAGTLLAFGALCEKREPSVEIWDAEGKSRIEPLLGVKSISGWFSKALPGKGDEVWVFLDGERRLVRYLDGKIAFSPELPTPARDAFVSPGRVLHAFDGQTLHALVDDAWRPVARFAFPIEGIGLGIEGETLWGGSAGLHGESTSFAKLVPIPSVDDVETCATPFVYLSDAHWKNEAGYTYPTTRKVLASFPDVAELSLVEVREGGGRRLGIVPKSRAQGQAVIAHVLANMKDEKPKLLCFQPEKPRVIALDKPLAPR